MKRYINKYFLIIAPFLVILGCNKELDSLAPHNVSFEQQQFSTPAGYTKATAGNYNTLAITDYETNWFNLSEFRGNNVKFIDNPSEYSDEARQFLDAFTYTNTESKDFGLSNAFWFASYKSLLSINLVLKNVSAQETNSVILEAKAENLFMRAFVYFNLVRLYGRPYYQNPETNLGVPLILKPMDLTEEPPSRATVKQTYDQIIDDLKQAIDNFKEKKQNSYASKYAAYALLSRVYLYMSGTKSQPNVENARLASKYADSVILDGGYSLLQNAAYSAYYNSDNLSNPETIWAINHASRTMVLPKLLMMPAGAYANSYSSGQVKPSADLLAGLAANDLRKNFYYTDPYPGNSTDVLSTLKYSFGYKNASGNGVLTSKAPFNHLRLAEVYLNRAEAKAKSGDDPGALADLNVIHTRAGLTPLLNLTGQALFDAILAERRQELAFEGHISYDYFRNGLPMVRNYASYNSAPMTVLPTDPKVVMRISQDVLAENPHIIQNAQ